MSTPPTLLLGYGTFYLNLYLVLLFRVTPLELELIKICNIRILVSLGYRTGLFHDQMFNVLEQYRLVSTTDRRTDGHGNSIYRASTASIGKHHDMLIIHKALEVTLPLKHNEAICNVP